MIKICAAKEKRAAYVVLRRKAMRKEKWLEWAVELQSIAQAGLYYGKDVFDIQRF